jgi:hypothetical protein
MAKKAKKKVRTTAQRRAAAKAAWELRRKGLPAASGKSRRKKKGRSRPDTTQALSVLGVDAAHSALLSAPGYDALAFELHAAFEQSAHGKGKVRHAKGRPFDRQPILELGRLYGPGFAAGQAAKKTQEALGMLARGDTAAALAELHGAIVYTAAMASLVRESVKK